MTLKKYWANRHSMVGEHDSLRTTTDIPIYLVCDVDAALRDAKADGLEKAAQELENCILVAGASGRNQIDVPGFIEWCRATAKEAQP